MLVSKKKSTLLKSIAAIMMSVVVAGVCLTGCADNEARNAAEEAKQAAEAKMTQEQVEKAIQDAIDKVKDQYTSIAQLEEILKKYQDSTEIQKLLENYTDTAALQKLLEDYKDSAAIQELLSQYKTSEELTLILADYQLKADLDTYMTSDKAVTAVLNILKSQDTVSLSNALENFLVTVEERINASWNSNVAQEEVAKMVEAYKDALVQEILSGFMTPDSPEFADAWEKVASQAVADVLKDIAKVNAEVESQTWLKADKAAIDAYYSRNLEKLVSSIRVETDDEGNVTDTFVNTQINSLLVFDNIFTIVRLSDAGTLHTLVDGYKDYVAQYVSVEQAAAKIDNEIVKLGVDLSDAYTGELLDRFKTVEGEARFGYVIVHKYGVPTDDYNYLKDGSLAHLNKEVLAVGDYIADAEGTVYLVVGVSGNDGANATKEEIKVVGPTFGDAEQLAKVADMISKFVEIYSVDYSEIRVEVANDNRTEHDESADYIYNTETGYIKNYTLYTDYQAMLKNIEQCGKVAIESVKELLAATGDGCSKVGLNNAEEIFALCAAAEANFVKYDTVRFENVVEGVEEARTQLANVETAIYKKLYSEKLAIYNAQFKSYVSEVGYELSEMGEVTYSLVMATRGLQIALTEAEVQEILALVQEKYTELHATMEYINNDNGFKNSAVISKAEYDAAIEALAVEYGDHIAKADSFRDSLHDGIYEIDARYCYTLGLIQKYVKGQMIDLAVAYEAWDGTLDKTVVNEETGEEEVVEVLDVYDRVVAYIANAIVKKVDGYTLRDVEKPYTAACNDLLQEIENAKTQVVYLQKWYDAKGDAENGKPSDDLLTLIEVSLADLKEIYTDLDATCKAVDADIYELEQYAANLKAMYETACDEVNLALIDDESYVNADFVKAVVTLENALPAKIDSMKNVSYQFQTERYGLAAADAFHHIHENSAFGQTELGKTNWKNFTAIVTKYASRMAGVKFVYTVGSGDIDEAYVAALATIDQHFVDGINEYVNHMYDLKYAEMLDEAEAYFAAESAEIIGDVSDALIDRIRKKVADYVETVENNQPHNLVATLIGTEEGALWASNKEFLAVESKYADLDGANGNMNKLLAQYEAVYAVAKDALDAEVELDLALLAEAVEQLEILATVKADALDEVTALYEKLSALKANGCDYKNQVDAAYDKVVVDINKCVISNENLPNLNEEGLITKECSELCNLIESYVADYIDANNMDDGYGYSMSEYPKYAEAFEAFRAEFVKNIDDCIDQYMVEAGERGLIIDVADEIFEENSPLYKSLVTMKNKALAIDYTAECVKSKQSSMDVYYNLIEVDGVLYKMIVVTDEEGYTDYETLLQELFVEIEDPSFED